MINIFKRAWAHFFHPVKWIHLFLSKTNTQLNVKTVMLQTMYFSVITQLFVFTQLNDQTVLFQTI